MTDAIDDFHALETMGDNAGPIVEALHAYLAGQALAARQELTDDAKRLAAKVEQIKGTLPHALRHYETEGDRCATDAARACWASAWYRAATECAEELALSVDVKRLQAKVAQTLETLPAAIRQLEDEADGLAGPHPSEAEARYRLALYCASEVGADADTDRIERKIDTVEPTPPVTPKEDYRSRFDVETLVHFSRTLEMHADTAVARTQAGLPPIRASRRDQPEPLRRTYDQPGVKQALGLLWEAHWFAEGLPRSFDLPPRKRSHLLKSLGQKQKVVQNEARAEQARYLNGERTRPWMRRDLQRVAIIDGWYRREPA